MISIYLFIFNDGIIAVVRKLKTIKNITLNAVMTIY